MRKERSPFPSQQGTPLAKDVWMADLVIDDLTDRPEKAASSRLAALGADVLRRRCLRLHGRTDRGGQMCPAAGLLQAVGPR